MVGRVSDLVVGVWRITTIGNDCMYIVYCKPGILEYCFSASGMCQAIKLKGTSEVMNYFSWICDLSGAHGGITSKMKCHVPGLNE